MGTKHHGKDPKDYRIILQQDAAEPLVHRFGAVSREALIAASVGQLEGVPVDMYASDVNTGGGAYFNSKSFEHHSAHWKRLPCGTALQMRNAIEQLAAEGTDPLKIYCEGAHAMGIDYMVRVRLNDLHDVAGYWMNISRPRTSSEAAVPQLYFSTSGWRLAHPEYLLGDPTDETDENSYEYWERCAPNYALGPVREYMLGLIEEVLNDCDLDALELDFMRMPFHFPRQERYAQRHVMTGFIGLVRRCCDEVGQRRGRPVRLSVRVPDTAEMCLRNGYDLARWLKEGYLDMVTISGGYSPFNTPWRDIASLCKASGVPALACLNYGPMGKDRNVIRAAAMRAYAQGVSGIELWNYFYCMDYYHAPGQIPLDFSFAKEIANLEALSDLEKTYVAGHYMSLIEPSPGRAYDNGSWPAQLPLMVGAAHAGVGNTVALDVADEMSSRAGGVAKMEVDVLDLGPTDELLFFFNGERILSDPGAWGGVHAEGKHHFEFTLACSAVFTGENTLELRLTRREERLMPFISLVNARITIPGAT